MKNLLLSTSLMLMSCNALGASVYQCKVDGVTTFSQTPCGEEYEELDIYSPSENSSNGGGKDALIESCVSVIKSNNEFNAPRSLIVGSTHTKWLSDVSGARNVLMVEISDKNTFSEYGDPKFYPCYLSQDGLRLSSVQYLVR